jgi:hypothetical protein
MIRRWGGTDDSLEAGQFRAYSRLPSLTKAPLDSGRREIDLSILRYTDRNTAVPGWPRDLSAVTFHLKHGCYWGA